MQDLSYCQHGVDEITEDHSILLRARTEWHQEARVGQAGAFKNKMCDDRTHPQNERLWLSLDINSHERLRQITTLISIVPALKTVKVIDDEL